ncbi:MAG TPA: hypothetical protein VEZ11_04375, partial [Thermoanaerobaculia bacterium]|nr:hypothetical protein [Thermoanaerobaculia bacterium]
MKQILFLLAALAAALPSLALDAPIRTQEMLSPVYSIEKKYRSMEGPSSFQKVYLGDREKPELLWITGVRTEMVGEDGSTPQLPELMCHVNVDLDSVKHQKLFGATRWVSTRFMTLSQGMLDARFPEGFAFPIASNEPLTVYTQVLNHNIENPHIKVRHRVTFTYVRDRDLQKPLKALINVGASGTVLIPQEPASMTASAAMPVKDAGGAHGMSCLMAPRAPNAAGMAGDYTDPQGHHLTGHWVVPPGRQVNHSDVTWFMSLPFDTKLHFAAMHLHPFAESIELRDVTANKVLFKANAQNPAKG